jgi:hypothetical protein
MSKNILILCANTKSAELEKPKLIELINDFYSNNQKNYYYVGLDLQLTNKNRCKSKIDKKDWIKECHFKSLKFDMILIEFCPCFVVSVLTTSLLNSIQYLLVPNGIFSIPLFKRYTIYTKGTMSDKKQDCEINTIEGIDIRHYLPQLRFYNCKKLVGNVFLNFKKRN